MNYFHKIENYKIYSEIDTNYNQNDTNFPLISHQTDNDSLPPEREDGEVSISMMIWFIYL